EQLRVEDVLVAVRVEHEDAHAGAKLQIDHVNRVADTDDEVDGAEDAGDGWKGDTMFEVELCPGCVEKRINIGVHRSQRVLDVVARDRVAADDLADEAIEGARIVDQKRHSRVERSAAFGVG